MMVRDGRNRGGSIVRAFEVMVVGLVVMMMMPITAMAQATHSWNGAVPPTVASGNIVNVESDASGTLTIPAGATVTVRNANQSNLSNFAGNINLAGEDSKVILSTTGNGTGEHAAFTMTGNITGLGSVEQTNLTNTGVTLTGTNTYTGTTTITGGWLTIASANSIGPADLIFSGGSLQISNNATNTTFANNIALPDAPNNASFNVGNNDVVFSGVISGTGTLDKSGNGVLTLSGANTYTGNTIIGGTGGISIAAANNIGSGTIFINNNSKLEITAPITLTQNITMAGTGNAATPTTSTISTGSNNVILNGVIGGGGVGSNSSNEYFGRPIRNFVKTGSGTLTLTGANTYVGNITVNEGSLVFNSNYTVAADATLTVNGTLGGTGTIAGASTTSKIVIGATSQAEFTTKFFPADSEESVAAQSNTTYAWDASAGGAGVAGWKSQTPPGPSISIGTQPAATTNVTYGNISGTLTAAATESEGKAVSYQWYSNATSSNSGGTSISGATSASYTIPTALDAGTYYYYCVVSSPSSTATPVPSSVASVVVAKATYSGTMTGSTTVISGETTTGATLTLPTLPAGATYPSTGAVGGTTAALITANSVSGTTLTFSTSSQSPTSATITFAITNATNYNSFDVVVTVTAASCNHSYTWVETATCLLSGTRTGTCTLCGHVSGPTSLLALGHNLGSWSASTATCLSAGYSTRSCSRCSHSETQQDNALGHNLGSWVTVPATCQLPGHTTRSCSRPGCAHSETQDAVPALGHILGSWSTPTAPTCELPGHSTRNCSRCSHSETQPVVSALGHSLGDWSTVTPATCLLAGQSRRTCSRPSCGHAETQSISALGHSYGSATTIAAASCEHPGESRRTCTRVNCGHVSISVLPALEHIWGPLQVLVPPTSTSEGRGVRVCQRDPSHTEPYILPAVPHTSISVGDQVVPGDIVDEAVIAPSRILSASLTAGPNPVCRGGNLPPAVNFYWQGRVVDDGVLVVYDALGNVVAAIKVTEDANRRGVARNALTVELPAPRRIIGTWDLKDNKGHQVSEGTYLVRGVINGKDGTVERVSVVVGVR